MTFGKIIAAVALAFAGIAGTSTVASANTVTVNTSMAAASASVQRHYRDDHRRWDRGDRRRWDRRHRYHRPAYNRGRYYRGGPRQICRTEWRRGHRVRICRRR
jgi:hypothetical protein